MSDTEVEKVSDEQPQTKELQQNQQNRQQVERDQGIGQQGDKNDQQSEQAKVQVKQQLQPDQQPQSQKQPQLDQQLKQQDKQQQQTLQKQTQHKQQEPIQQQKVQITQEIPKTSLLQQSSQMNSDEGSKSMIKHQQIGKYANVTMELEEEQEAKIKLRIAGSESKSTTFLKYTAYVIKGYDDNGEINVSRRFSEFHAMRTALCKRWPGCFIPSIPEKNFMGKNDKEEIVKRERYLTDFLYKLTKLPHLYLSEQFQALIRSGVQDISSMYDSWSPPTYEAIINKYRECFGDLAGKQIDQASNDKIASFYALIQKNQALVDKYRLQTRNLAQSLDKYNRHFPFLFSKIIPGYEQILMGEYTNGTDEHLVFLNPNQPKMCQQQNIIKDASSKNPYWLLYDMLKHQQRDGKAFMEMIKNRQNLESKKHTLEIKIKQTEITITSLAEGKKTLASMTSKSSNDEIKYKREAELEEMKKELVSLTNLLDIITAIIIYIEIPEFKQEKISFYQNILRKIGGFEINTVQLCGEVWQATTDVADRIDKISAN